MIFHSNNHMRCDPACSLNQCKFVCRECSTYRLVTVIPVHIINHVLQPTKHTTSPDIVDNMLQIQIQGPVWQHIKGTCQYEKWPLCFVNNT